MSDKRLKFQQGLGARIDALQVALSKLEGDDANAESMIKQLASAIGEQATELDVASIGEAANRVAETHGGAIEARTHELIDQLRAQAGVGRRRHSTILLIGGNPRLQDEIPKHLDAPNLQIIRAETAAEAQRLVKQHDIACIVMHTILPDLDGRTLFDRFRENPTTASVPVLIVANKLDQTVKEDSRLHAADSYAEGTETSKPIAEWITQRIRRAPEANKAARRDQLTGLMNHAAFRETFRQIQSECSEAKETLALAVLSIDGSRTVLTALDAADCENLLQDFGLRLSNSFRSTDVVARGGTYEFFVLFPGEDLHGSTRAVEKIIESVKREPLVTSKNTEVRVSISAGVTLVSVEMTLDDALASANQFVYLATSRGGNQVVSDTTKRRTARLQRVFLLVQDAVTKKVLTQLFEKEGFQVTQCDEWNSESNDLLKQQRHHLVVLDAHFPPSDGFEVLEKLRSDPKHSRLPIAMLVDADTEEHVTQALELGANDYVTRPLSPFTFIGRMRRLMSRGVQGGERSSQCPRILIVDNEVGQLVLAATSLQQSGAFEVILARGPKDAFERLQYDSPEALLIDGEMRTQDNELLLEGFGRRDLLSDVSVILAMNPNTDSKKPGIKNIIGTIEKPYNAATLGKRVCDMLRIDKTRDPDEDLARRFNEEIQRITKKPDQ